MSNQRPYELRARAVVASQRNDALREDLALVRRERDALRAECDRLRAALGYAEMMESWCIEAENAYFKHNPQSSASTERAFRFAYAAGWERARIILKELK